MHIYGHPATPLLSQLGHMCLGTSRAAAPVRDAHARTWTRVPMAPLQTHSHTPGHGQGADTGTLMHSQVCTCSITAAAKAAPHAGTEAPANQLWHATPTQHTPTQTAFFLFPNFQRCRQTDTLTPLHLFQTPTHCCRCPEGMGCAESTYLCLPPLCLDFPKG